MTIAYHPTQVCFCIVLMFYTTLGGPYWFLSLVIQKAFRRFLLVINYFIQPVFIWPVL